MAKPGNYSKPTIVSLFYAQPVLSLGTTPAILAQVSWRRSFWRSRVGCSKNLESVAGAFCTPDTRNRSMFRYLRRWRRWRGNAWSGEDRLAMCRRNVPRRKFRLCRDVSCHRISKSRWSRQKVVYEHAAPLSRRQVRRGRQEEEAGRLLMRFLDSNTHSAKRSDGEGRLHSALMMKDAARWGNSSSEQTSRASQALCPVSMTAKNQPTTNQTQRRFHDGEMKGASDMALLHVSRAEWCSAAS